MEEFSYKSPFSSRYASKAMQKTLSHGNRYMLWRRLWCELARAQMELGLPISASQVELLEQHVSDIDFGRVAQIEKETRHEVIAHIRAYGEVCPEAKPIIHLGATSAFVMDNSDLLIAKQALNLIESELITVIDALARQAQQHKNLPVLGFTHFQPAQLTTLGKRICMWLQDFAWDLAELRHVRDNLPFLGMKGATGTQASVLKLFDGDQDKVEQLDVAVAKALGFNKSLIISGQTYSRKVDSRVYAVLCGIAESAAKMATDIRLLQHLGEVFEPFGEHQVGSSAMPYKRNPMACERICGISRFLITLTHNGSLTASSQWLERSLDDSSNKRIATPEALLAADSILRIAYEVADGLFVSPARIKAHIARELPFMATEDMLMLAVKAGGDRQELHERLRVHSLAAAKRLAEGATDNDLFERMAKDPSFNAIKHELEKELEPTAYTGLAEHQVERFLHTEIEPILKAAPIKAIWDTPIEV